MAKECLLCRARHHRHSFASHAIHNGHDIFALKRWLGHNALATTGRYMHVVPGVLNKVVSPLDTLAEA